ncbi:hypothetical protein [Clostridium sp. JS66]|uniref:hypothetical protein n=1 Tax=Clostridium sp. JS66 TaxID=3064705 RepID=UPI00298E0F86|nr:hypothetical protein [Clostridium sp. JS66]WPC42384.1 hypothetical protein Q6H37_02665 [Clostridium sp. JS66]
MLKYLVLSIIISSVIFLSNILITFLFSKYNFQKMKRDFITGFITLFIPFINMIIHIGLFKELAMNAIKNKNLTCEQAKNQEEEEFKNGIKEAEERLNKRISENKLKSEKSNKEEKEKYERINKMNQLQLGSCSGTYLGGYEELVETGHGKINLTNKCLEFKITEGSKTGEFKLPLRQIKNIAYDTEKNLTLSRILILGVFALGMKKNSYYLVIDYTNDYDISNQIIFNLGYEKNQDFYNKLNVQRNKCIKEYIDIGKSRINM